jgi:hypothetical protein
MKAMIFIFVRELIKRILREETKKKKKDLSPTIKELLDVVVKEYKGTICSVDVIAPWKRLSVNPNHEEYEIRINIIGGIGSKNWPQTQFVHRQREKIVDDVWQTVYNYLGVTSSIFTRNVKSCDEVLSESIEDIQGTPLYHHTTESRALSIMNSNMMRATRPDDDILELDPTLANTKHQSMVSFTRDKNFMPNSTIGASTGGVGDENNLKVIFVVDKDKLKSKYKIVPFDYSSLEDRWYDKRMKDEPDTIMQPRAIRTSKSNEYEERVLTNKIEPLRRYIIDIIYKGDNPLVQEKIDEYLNRDRQEEPMNEGLHDTSWQNDDGDKITLVDLLDATEDIPVKNIPVEKIKSKLLTWDDDDKEIAKIEKADLQYPILIFVDDNNKFISIIDGHHRAQKAARHKLKTIKAKLIPINSLPKNIRKVFGHLGKQEQNESELTERCWKGYTQKGMKTMFGKRYPNCVKIKKKRVNESNVIDYLKKFVGYKATDQKYQFQKIVDIITKITKRDNPIEGLAGVAVTHVKKDMWGQTFTDPKSVGMRWDFKVILRPLFTEYNPNKEEDYSQKVLKFEKDFLENAHGMGLGITSPIEHEKVKDYKVTFEWTSPLRLEKI